MTENLHELSALYALDVLDRDDRDRFEAHLSSCSRCRDELGGLRDAASALAFVEGPAPPAAFSWPTAPPPTTTQRRPDTSRQAM
jgi:anti-sigma factor RsiW